MTVPSKNILEATSGLFKNGFEFIQKSCDYYGTDLFQINAPGLKVICIRGEEAAQIFYDNEKMERKGAVPPPVQQTLTGVDAIHTKDGEAHHHRKRMFLSLMTDENIARLRDLFHERLRRVFQLAAQQDSSVVLFYEAQRALCWAVCTWAGVPLPELEVPARASQFVTMIDAFGSVGTRNLRGKMGRNQVEQWIAQLIMAVREGRFVAEPGTALAIAAAYPDETGVLFDEKMAAIELINVLRPTVAISWYIIFGATALHQYPETERKFAANQNNYRENFVNEVRRYYPFAPFMGAKVRNPFSWNGCEFPKGTLVLLDMYGTNHDARLWEQPYLFNPERFIGRTIKPFDFLAQGGGDVELGHRCPGEWITIELLKAALEVLTTEVTYVVPEQDLSYDLSRMPTYPKSGFVMRNIKMAPAVQRKIDN